MANDSNERPKSFDEMVREDLGYKLHRDAPPKGKRSNKDLVATLVSAARRVQDRINCLAEEKSVLAEENAALIRQIGALKMKAVQNRIEMTLDLPEDRQRFLLTGETPSTEDVLTTVS